MIGLARHHYWTNVCPSCPIKERCTTGKERRISRWEHEHVLEAVQQRLDENPEAMRQRRETVEHPFGTLKARMGATHFLMKRLRNVRTEMALSVLKRNPRHAIFAPGPAHARRRARSLRPTERPTETHNPEYLDPAADAAIRQRFRTLLP